MPISRALDRNGLGCATPVQQPEIALLGEWPRPPYTWVKMPHRRQDSEVFPLFGPLAVLPSNTDPLVLQDTRGRARTSGSYEAGSACSPT